MFYIEGLPYLGKAPTQSNLEMVISAHKAAGTRVGGAKGFNKNGNVTVSGVSMPLNEFYQTCVAVAVELGGWQVGPPT